MTEATPLSLRYDGIMSGAIWAFCVDECSFQCCSILLFIYFTFYFFLCFPFLLSSALYVHFIFNFFFAVFTLGPTINRNDPAINYCIFDQDLDNGNHLCSWGNSGRCCHSHFISNIVTNNSHTVQFRAMLQHKLCLCNTIIWSCIDHKSIFLFSEHFPQTMFSLVVCNCLWDISALAVAWP